MIFRGNVLDVVGHRGWPRRFPDNTLAGMGAAFGVVDMVETDVRRTADGVLVLSHDPSLLGLVVAESTWADLAQVDLGGGLRPIRLDEALAAFPDRRFDLEVKNHPAEPGFEEDGRIGADVAAVARPGDLITSFWWPTVETVRARRAEVETGLLVDCLVTLDDAVDVARAGGHAVVAAGRALLTDGGAAGTVRRARQAGVRIAAWTVNDPAEAARFAEMGVSAIITDDAVGMTADLERGG